MARSLPHQHAALGERLGDEEQKLPATLGQRMAKVFDELRREGMSTEAIYLQLYSDLRTLAHKKAGPAPRVSGTSMVNTIWIRLLGKDPDRWTDGKHFVNCMARAMQNLLIDAGREPRPVTLPPDAGDDGRWKNRIQVGEALRYLEAHDKRQADIMRLVNVAGFTQEEAAQELNCSLSTVKKEYRKAKAWLKDYLDNDA